MSSMGGGSGGGGGGENLAEKDSVNTA